MPPERKPSHAATIIWITLPVPLIALVMAGVLTAIFGEMAVLYLLLFVPVVAVIHMIVFTFVAARPDAPEVPPLYYAFMLLYDIGLAVVSLALLVTVHF